MAQLMPLPLTVSCFSKIQIAFTFLVLAYPGCPGKEAVKWLLLLLLSVRLIISTSAELIFTGFVELWSEINNLKFFFNPSRYVAVATNFVGKIDLQYSPCSLCNIR